MRSAVLVVLTLATAASAACASSPPATVCASNAPCVTKTTAVESTAQAPAVAKIWQSRCGSCHVRVEPGTRGRATLETALSRHRNRVRMDEAQWSALVTFLAADAPGR